jgi:hypothetical protein
MPRYHFHLRKNGILEVDPEGAELPTLDAARDEAVLAAREILAERLLQGEVLDGDCFVITREDGTTVMEVPFKEAIRLD